MLPTFFVAFGLALLFGGLLSYAFTRVLIALASVRSFTLLLQARRQDDPPRIGGLAIFLAFALTPFLVALLSPDAAFLVLPKVRDFAGFLAAGTVVFALGLLDDLFILDYKQKYAGQALAGLAVYLAGYQIALVGLPWGATISLGPLAPVVTVLWIVFFANAVNLIDGKDGVATGVVLFAALALGHVAARTNHPTVALLLIAVAGAALGFLPRNLPKATAYLGDSGALFLGFVLAALSIRAVTGVGDAVFISVPLVALGFPLLDTVLAPMRRFLDHRHPFLRDEDHIHHRLAMQGFGPRGMLIVVYSISALFAVAAVTLHYVESAWAEGAVSLFVVAIVGVILARLRYLGSLWNSRRVVAWRRRLRPEH
jgi:UDP-GlcNAc:undecaprenyl-phosphate GlcNAc-1-phosphate transferase